MLWNRNFSLLIAADCLLHIAIYMLFPLLYRWMMQQWGLAEWQAGAMAVLFGLSMFLPGAFSSYLVDTFSRKSVCTRSILLLAVTGGLYPHLSAWWMVVGVSVLQAVLLGVALMATGSTLAIDVTPSSKRDAANRVFAWASMLGMFVGTALGFWGQERWGVRDMYYLSGGICVLSAVLVSLVRVCFRAPLELPLCSFDRFLLFRALLPGINMMVVPLVLGVLFASIHDTFFYLCIGSGFAVYLFVREIFTRPLNGRVQILSGQLLVLFGLAVLYVGSGDGYVSGSGFLVGLGTGFSIGQFLRMMILLPRHCERGTGFNTFQLLWGLGFALGVCLAGCMDRLSHQVLCSVASGVCLTGLLFYQLCVHDYFIRHYQQK